MAKTRSPTVLPDSLAAALALFALVAPLVFLQGKSAVYDEVSHLPAGYTYLTTGVVRLNPQHPPLVKEMCALPLLGLPLRSLDPGLLRRPDLPAAFEWQFGAAFMQQEGADRILRRGRIPAVLLSAALAVLVWAWARGLWGAWGGALAVALYALDPTLSAHAQLVTTDVGCAFFSVLAVLALRQHLRLPSRRRLALAAAGLGLALGAKFSAIALVPVYLVFLVESRWSRTEGAGRRRRVALALAGDVALVAAVAYAVLFVVYLAPSDPLFYWRGLRTVYVDHNPAYESYLMGELKRGGWRHYLLVAALVKTPLPTLALVGAALAVALAGWRRLGREDALLLLPAAAYLVLYSFAANIGVRYVIPALPFLFVFAGRLLAQRPSRPAAAAVAGLALWLVVEFASVAPDHLSYFNQVAGGTRNGYRWLCDSNVDWGQGLLQLRTYLREHPRPAYRLCQFGAIPPGFYGLPDNCYGSLDELAQRPSGTVILSAHYVAYLNGTLRRRYGDGPGNWVLHTPPTAFVGHAFFVYDLP